MITVVFRAKIKQGMEYNYAKLACAIKPKLADIDGFISDERLMSIDEDRRIVSISKWKDEESIFTWRRLAKIMGEDEILEEYESEVIDGTC